MEVASKAASVGHVFPTWPEGRVLPLNLRCLTAAHLRVVAGSMGLPTKVLMDEIQQLIEGKLSEDGRELQNVQVIVQEPSQVGEGDSAQARLCLVDDGGVFMEMRIVAVVGGAR